ncbi:hypothetical protein N7E81_10735 [Reichenbachiella carrageenanivorans]|uniref:Tetratricopeptide repeat-containing protein n=1 Tax=Reichenbachiella carrageenanivorans TaxID=2979869 RepID=A0ABY6CVE9_9BACT|nr:hypothetical protein [Reichenbachiella carrageenanivorans]UXX77843.1 hypothetical protein N7E81_10735 [Reichenbachiella carrageenanivorans]
MTDYQLFNNFKSLINKYYKTRQFALFLIASLGVGCPVFCQEDSAAVENSSLGHLEKATELMFQNADSAILLFKLSYVQSMQTADTLQAIDCLVNLSDLYANNADFDLAYDSYWEALFLADQMDHSGARAKVYSGLGWLYSLYKRDNQAIKYFTTSLKINKVRIQQMNLNKHILLKDYYALATLYRKNKDYKTARLYLDSCRLVQNIQELLPTSRSFVSAELGYNLYIEGKYQEALKLLLPLEPFFTANYPDYFVIYHSFLGQIYQALGDLPKAKSYFESAIASGLYHKSHMDLMPDLYEALSLLLVEMGEMNEAYAMLTESMRLNEQLFGSRSENNKFILEIKDEFRLEKENQDKKLNKEKLARLEQEDKVWYLQSLILYGTIIFLIIVIFLVYRYFRTRYKAEKKLLKEKQRLELLKTKEVLEVKNKELTASALQVIQRDEVLTDLKNQINEQKDNPDTKKLTKLVKSIDISSSNNWKEFESRFISVNKSFYKELNSVYPGLSQGDQKICALIKLNFTSKDMAKLLGISIESVHTTRYRLRKKLNLDRSDNLEDFIGKFE